MSDAVIISLIGSVSTTFGVVVAAWFNTRQNRKIQEKVTDYHKEVNGKMSELLVTTEALGKATGKAEEKQEQEDKNNNSKQ